MIQVFRSINLELLARFRWITVYWIWEYEAEIVLHLLLIAIPNSAESKDLNDDFRRFFSNWFPVSPFRIWPIPRTLKEKWRFSSIFLKFASDRLFEVQITNIKLELCCVFFRSLHRIQPIPRTWGKNDDFRRFFFNSLLVGHLKYG